METLEFGFLCCLSMPGLSKDMRHREILSEFLCCLTMCGLSREREREGELKEHWMVRVT